MDPFDDAIIESPKNSLRKNRKMRLNQLNEEENIVAEDIDELDSFGQQVERDPVVVQTYKFAELAEFIVEKEEDFEFDEDLEEDES